jgi:hypothetical protein
MLAAALGIALIGASVLFPRLVGSIDTMEPPSSTSPKALASVTPPARVPLGEQASCIRLVPAATDGTAAIRAIVQQPDGSTVDWPNLRETITELKDIRGVAPPTLTADIDSQLKALEHLLALGEGHGRGRLELDAYRAAGLRIADRCGRYAS